MHRAWAACAYLYVFVSRYLSVTGILICVGYLYVVLYYPYMCANKFVNLSCPIRLEINFKCYLYVVRMLFLGNRMLPYISVCYSYVLRMLLVGTRLYPYVTRLYPCGVLVKIVRVPYLERGGMWYIHKPPRPRDS